MFTILINCFYKGGQASFIKILTDNLDKKTFSSYDISGKEICNLEFKTKTFWNKIKRRYWLFTYFYRYCNRLKKLHISLVHLNPSLDWNGLLRNYFFLKIAYKYNVPTLLFFHGWKENVSKKILKNNYWKTFFSKRFIMADLIVVLANQFKKELIDIGIPRNKVIVLPTMTDTKEFIIKERSFKKPFKILYCGNMYYKKGVFELINAISLILKKEQEIKFYFMGEGPDLDRMKRMVKKLFINEHVIFLGFKLGKEKIKYFQKADLFAFPSYSEGCPLAVLEALSAGLPVVSTKVGGLAEILEDGENGFFINSVPPDPNEIADKITKLISDPNLIKKISKNNILKAKNNYDVKIITKKIENIYLKLINDSKDVKCQNKIMIGRFF